MTYEERKKWICEQCNQKTDCAYVIRNMEYKCLLVEERMEDWELGYKDAIDKFCKFMQDCEGYVVSGNKCNYENFIKYMEEQQ